MNSTSETIVSLPGLPMATIPQVEEHPRPRAVPLGDLIKPSSCDPTELLKHRYLCQGGGLLLVGPTGIGKSSFSMQCMVSWALGRACFGMTPARKLKSLLVQAENDEGDLAEMRDGVMNGLSLAAGDRAQVARQILVCQDDAKAGELFFKHTVGPLLEDVRPDLLWIDPALAYLGGESSNQRDVGKFLREGLNPLIRKYKCGAVVVHHTNKPFNGPEKPAWSGSDLAYIGNGSAEWCNWSRGVLAIRGIGSDSVFELIAPKRGKRLGWKNPDGVTKTNVQFISHARGQGELYWRNATPEDLEGLERKETKKKDNGVEAIMPLIPCDRPIPKEALIESCSQQGICGLRKARTTIDDAVGSKQLFAWHISRVNARAEVWIGRTPQPKDFKPGDEVIPTVSCRQANQAVSNQPQ